jgi:outer membrane receptor protein involved in Fe transport
MKTPTPPRIALARIARAGRRAALAALAASGLLTLSALTARADEVPLDPPPREGDLAAAHTPEPVGERARRELPPLEVTGTRRPLDAFESPRATSGTDRRSLEDRQVRFAPDALRETVGVMVQQTGSGQGSPFVRGLTGNQVLILVDGVRLNNSTFRFGANQYMATIDPFTIDRVEVLRGPGSVLYGSDAVGGVIQVLTRERRDFSALHDVGGGLVGRYGSAARERTGRVEADAQGGPVALTGGFTWSDFDDLRGGRRTGVQPFTAYRQEAGDVKAQARIGTLEVALAHQYLAQYDVDRTDRLTLALPGSLPPSLHFEFDPQRRNLTTLSARSEELGDLPLAAFRSNASFHRQEEHRDEITRASPTRLAKDKDVVETWGTSHQLETKEVLRQVVTAGIEAYRDHVISRRRRVDLASGATTVVRPRFADGATYGTLAVYAQDEVRIVPGRVVLTLGGRYTRIDIDGDFTDATPGVGTVTLDQEIDALVGQAHLWVSPLDELAFTGGVSQGFRAPNFDDLSVFGSVSGSFEVPNPDADPERSLATEIGAKWRLPGEDPLLTGAVFGHWTEFRDLLQRTNGTLDGLSFVDGDGDGVQDPGEVPVVTRRNVGQARIFGVEVEARLRAPREVSLAGERWSASGHFSWTYGSDLENDVPVRGIPPASALVGLRCEVEEGQYWLEGTGAFVRAQERLNPGDLADPRVPPGGTPGYEVYSLRGGARFTLFRGETPFRAVGVGSAASAEKPLNAEWTLGIENILDRDYRVHGSGVNGAGTNFVTTLAVRF